MSFSSRQSSVILALAFFVLPQLAFAGAQTYSTPGSYTFTVPTYGTLTVTLKGAGGGGGGPYLHPGGSSYPGQPGGASSIAAWSLYGYGGGGGGTVRYNTYPQEDGNSIGYDQSGSDGAPGSASGGTTNTAGGGGAGGGRWYPLPCGVDYAAGNSCEVHSGAGGAGGQAIKTYTAGTSGAPAADSQVSVVVGSGGAVGQYAYPGYPLPTNGSAGSVVITWTDNQAPAAPSISGPASGELDTSYTYTFDATDPESETIRYAIDWNDDGSVDEYAPALGYVANGASASTTHSWSATGDYTFRARTQDSNGNNSSWSSYSVTVGYPAPVVLLTASPSSISTGQSSTLTWSSAYADSCSATNFTIPNISATPTVIYLTSGSSWTVPSDWNSSNNVIEVIGGGGGGSGATDTPGAGGGGGAYAKATNVSLTPGASVAYAVGIGGALGSGSQSGSNGGDTYLCDSATGCGTIDGGNVVVGAKGGSGGSPGPANGSGGVASSGVGEVKYSGGNGGLGYGGAGGGGAGGPHGVGGNGATSNSNCFCNIAGPGGGGGGGGSSGNSGSGETGGAGGANYLGAGAGSGGNTQSSAPDNATAGGGGGGGGYEGGGATGGTGTEWGATHGAGGGGGGSGNSNWLAPHNGGHGGLYGGGGGSGGRQRLGPASSGGNGAQGLIVITYHPETPTVSGSIVVSPTETTTYTVTCEGDGGEDSSTKTVTYNCTPTNQCSGQDVVNSCTGAVVQSCGYQCSAGACVAPPPPEYNPIPGGFSGHLQVRPALVPVGATARVYWSLSHVGSCSVTGANGDAWSGASSGAGGRETSPITARTSYSLACTGLDDSSIYETAIINLVPVFQER